MDKKLINLRVVVKNVISSPQVHFAKSIDGVVSGQALRLLSGHTHFSILQVLCWDMLGAPSNIAGAPSNSMKGQFCPSFKKIKSIFFPLSEAFSLFHCVSSAKAYSLLSSPTSFFSASFSDSPWTHLLSR